MRLCTFMGLLLVGVAVLGRLASAADRPPNVVFILADDLGYSDLACYGHPYARTPVLDQLARDGISFHQFYATGITCCPARTGLMTSKFPATFHDYPAGAGFGNRVTVTELLHKAGYRTGHFGKWHIGLVEKPGTYGIDVIGTDDEAQGGKRQSKESDLDHGRGRDAHIYDQAIQFVQSNKDHPFYMNVWSHVSHYVVNPPQKYVDLFKEVIVEESKFSPYMHEKFEACKKAGVDAGECMRKYMGDVYSMDEDIGRLLKRIDELGLRSNTIVVFSSDQGPGEIENAGRDGKSDEKAKLRLNSMGYAGDFRGGKHYMYEGGVRVPFIVRWPNHAPAGRVDDLSVISGIDWLPTLCQIAGVGINPADFDGQDMSGTWLGKPAGRARPLFWKTSSVGSELAIRDGNWKFFYPNQKRGEVELYDLSIDPAERHNAAKAQPDAVKRLTAKVQQWDATLPKEYVKTADRDK